MEFDSLHNYGPIFYVLSDTRDRLVGHGFDYSYLARV